MKSTKLLVTLLIVVFPTATMCQNQSKNSKTASSVIELIIKNTGAPILPKTVDIIKEGDPQTKVKGIVTTMFATMDVLKKAVEMNSNLIISHEPLYYNHLDETKQFQNDPVFLEKQKYIMDNGLVIWRFHDYIHMMKPDGISMGMIEKLGWNDYRVDGSLDKFKLPESSLIDLLKDLKLKFPGNAFQVIGKSDLKVTNVAFDCGAPGSMAHIRDLRDTNIDVVIAGESPQWETYEYARDAVSQGRKKAVIFIGHINSEEAGMEYCAKWLQGFIKDIPIKFVESGPAHWTY
ncbi:MAG TPA: Nif3-like dinuclear metal center hexameric protein [Bacteroidales bacterium]|nr:Nif3-like dinuclear metal center hexameric protein [Bacteroidales bacterium]